MANEITTDTVPNFRALTDQITGEIKRLMRERQEIDRKLISLKHSLRGIEGYLEAEHDHLRLDPIPLETKWEGLREMGLTDAVRKVIQNSLESVNAKEIRAQLEALDYRKLPKLNPLAPIHAILTRLEKHGEVRRVGGVDGKPAYEWEFVDFVEQQEQEQRMKDRQPIRPRRRG
jgi:hypothetical protein